jgi:hypothetical protein
MWRNGLICAVLAAASSVGMAFMPQTGTWVVSSELNGKPGRGMNIDVQNDTLVLQMYAYEANGSPTFYTAVGRLVNNATTAPLTSYSGGRYFGSGERIGSPASAPGNVRLRFTSGTKGFVTFPNETEKAIARYNFAYPAVPNSLKGYWMFNSIGDEGVQTDVILFATPGSATTNGSGLMISSDGLMGCEHQVGGSLVGSVVCVKINRQGALVRSYIFEYSINDGDGSSRGATSRSDQALTVRRLTNVQGTSTGVLLKAEQEPSPEHPGLRHYIDILSENGGLL